METTSFTTNTAGHEVTFHTFNQSKENTTFAVKVAAVKLSQRLTLIVVVLVMFGLGCSANLKRFIGFVKNPKQFLTATFLQLLLLPIIGFAITQVLRLSPPLTIGTILVSAAPGGAFSNVATYWCDGDMDMSVIMTTSSTLFSMATIPMWLYTFTTIIKLETKLQVPFQWMAIGLFTMVTPVVLGMLLKRFYSKPTRMITKICTLCGSLLLVVLGCVMLYSQVLIPFISFTACAASSLLLTLGALTAYCATRVPYLRYSVAARRTVAIETAFQNVPVAFNVVFISYGTSEIDVIGPMILVPYLYAVGQLGIFFISIAIYLILKRVGVKAILPLEKENESPIDDDAEEVENALVQ